jgi:hypothetical protein
MTPPRKTTDPSATTEELVAYLDGELEPDSARRVERLLSDDPQVRLEVQRLERAWDLLDELPRGEVGEQFTRTTVSMVALAAEEDLRQAQAAEPARRRRAALAAGLALCVASLAGFAAVGWWQHDPNEELLRDLAILERLDEYRQAGEIEFLRMLVEERVFAQSVDPSANVPPAGDEPGASLAKRRERVAQMPEPEKQQLRERQEYFEQLDPAERQRLRALDADLAADPQGPALRRAMSLYYEWLKTIDDATERAELRQRPPAERLARVEELRAEQARQAERRLLAEDQEVLRPWLEEAIRTRLPEDERAAFDAAEPGARMWLIGGELWRRYEGWQGAGNFAKKLTPEELTRLHDALSPEAQARLDARGMLEQQQALVGDWIGELLWSFGRRAQRTDPSDPELERFFREGLTAQRQAELDGLPEHRRRQRIREWYLEWREAEGLPPPEPSGFGPPPGGDRGQRFRSRRPQGGPPGPPPPEQERPAA